MVALIDVAWAAGEAALRLASLFFGVLLGDKALGAAVEGMVGFLLVGNLWWPVLHGICLLGVLVRSRWGWAASALLLGGRTVFALVTGAPHLPIANGEVSVGFTAFMVGLFALGGLAHLWHGVPRRAVE